MIKNNRFSEQNTEIKTNTRNGGLKNSLFSQNFIQMVFLNVSICSKKGCFYKNFNFEHLIEICIFTQTSTRQTSICSSTSNSSGSSSGSGSGSYKNSFNIPSTSQVSPSLNCKINQNNNNDTMGIVKNSPSSSTTSSSTTASVANGFIKKSSSRRNAWGNYSYADLITKAITTSPEHRLTLSQIYDWMTHNLTYFKDKGDSNSSAGWKVSHPFLFSFKIHKKSHMALKN